MSAQKADASHLITDAAHHQCLSALPTQIALIAKRAAVEVAWRLVRPPLVDIMPSVNLTIMYLVAHVRLVILEIRELNATLVSMFIFIDFALYNDLYLIHKNNLLKIIFISTNFV